MAEKFCEYTKKKSRIRHFKMVDFMVCELYLNFLKKQQQK